MNRISIQDPRCHASNVDPPHWTHQAKSNVESTLDLASLLCVMYQYPLWNDYSFPNVRINSLILRCDTCCRHSLFGIHISPYHGNAITLCDNPSHRLYMYHGRLALWDITMRGYAHGHVWHTATLHIGGYPHTITTTHSVDSGHTVMGYVYSTLG